MTLKNQEIHGLKERKLILRRSRNGKSNGQTTGQSRLYGVGEEDANKLTICCWWLMDEVKVIGRSIRTSTPDSPGSCDRLPVFG